MPESRSDKRKERYMEAKALGFSVEQARRLRDRSGNEIRLAYAREARRISRKPIQMRTSEESFRLNRIRERQITATKTGIDARIDSRKSRWKKFSEYSKNGAWPKRLRTIARQYNNEAGKESPDDSYGYRRLYYHFVERLPEERSEILAERNDSNARYLTNKPLVSGRENLRRLFETPKAKERRLKAS